MFYAFYDIFYLLVLAAIGFSMWASARVNSTFRTYSQQRTRNGMTGYDAAREVLDANGLYDVRIERISGNLTDHFDPARMSSGYPIQFMVLLPPPRSVWPRMKLDMRSSMPMDMHR